VFDSNERPGAFFAMTVCFAKSYCTNVHKLFELFETVYNKVCIGSIIAQKQNKEIYLVSDFKASRTNNGLTVDLIHNIFIKNIGDLIQPNLEPIGGIADTFNKSKRQISLLEVDSPLFVKLFKEQSIVVLPNLEPAATTNQTLLKQLNAVSAQKKNLETVHAQMASDINTLRNENKSITNRFNESISSSERKYSATITQLKDELNGVKQERDMFKAKLEEAKSSIEVIDRPFQKLTRLLAGRFPEQTVPTVPNVHHNPQTNTPQNKGTVRYSRINTILLSFILFFVIAILALTLISFLNNNNSCEEAEPVAEETINEAPDSTDYASESGTAAENNAASNGHEDQKEYADKSDTTKVK
jgi:hypothetical protein